MKTPENSILGPFWILFVYFIAKRNFSFIFVFLDLYHRTKLQKKLRNKF